MSHEPESDRTSGVPGYQPTERLDRAALEASIGAAGSHPSVRRPTASDPSATTPTSPGAETEPDPQDSPEPEPQGGAISEPEPEPEPEPRGEPEPQADAAGERSEPDADADADPDAPTTPEPPLERETAEIVRRLPQLSTGAPAPEREVTILDLPVYRLRRPGDLVAAVVAVVGIAVVLLLAVFAHATTEGVTQDVQNALPAALRAVLLAPVNFLEGVVTVLLPAAVVVERLIRRQPRLVLEAIVAATIAALLTVAAMWALTTFGSQALIDGVTTVTTPRTSFVPGIAALAALLTVTGSTDHRRLVAWTWNLLWVTLVLQVLRNGMTLPGALTSVLVGRTVGMAARYLTGVLGDRAYGEHLVGALRRCGIDPVRVLRIIDGRPIEGAEPVVVVTDDPIGYVTDSGVSADLAPDGEPESASWAGGEQHEDAPDGERAPAHDATLREASHGTGDPTAAARPAVVGAPANEPHAAAAGPTTAASARERLTTTWDFSSEIPVITEEIPPAATQAQTTHGTRSTSAERGRPPLRTATAVIGEEEGENRIYSVRDSSGRVWDVGVLDGDRQVVGALAAFWSAIRLRGLRTRTVVSLRAAVERAALMSYAADAAGVRTPTLRGLTTEQDSAILVSEHVSGTRTFADVQTRHLTDEVLDRIWAQVRAAHAAGLAHRNLDDQAILLDADDEVLLTGWTQGEVSSPELARRLDLAHLLALLALRVGAERAMASAARTLTREDLIAIAPILQPVALPERTRAEARKNKKVLAEVQEILVGVIPTVADVQPMQMRRFSVRTIVTVTVAAVAGWLVLTSFNLQQMVEYVQEANPAWLAAAFVLGLLTYVGSAMGLVAFAPVRLSLWRTSLVQIAASVVALVAPAGVGPAAMNLRFLQKNRLDTPMAVATVALVQVSQFVTTILLLIGIALVTGSSGALDTLPSGAVVIGVSAIAAAVGVGLLLPRVRTWVFAKIRPTLQQIWPRLVWVVGQPGRLLMGLGGNLVMTVGYIAAFGCTLAAFGESIPLTSLAIVYLAGNAAGSAVPTPGGIGTVELALSSGLRAAGVGAAAALASAFVFRLLTFWIRVPLGWLALRWLQKRNLV
ncbi:lysylphosphatidylglycerol synthase domain-containing protein [Miniimonas sp. S16]|uniref:lysylphosphatidylglycerol synthase domain-containing protein n=1 Tax=Miniimonas sp. S16 TaxID=2171623 RepID=UPI000D5266BA|nr:lysylphosphatidylglycerol synthase domain-containing protein [Miniimonas sp. S16]